MHLEKAGWRDFFVCRIVFDGPRHCVDVAQDFFGGYVSGAAFEFLGHFGAQEPATPDFQAFDAR
jgi:hypothetical protein